MGRHLYSRIAVCDKCIKKNLHRLSEAYAKYNYGLSYPTSQFDLGHLIEDTERLLNRLKLLNAYKGRLKEEEAEECYQYSLRLCEEIHDINNNCPRLCEDKEDH